MNRFWRMTMVCAALCVALAAIAVGAAAAKPQGKGTKKAPPKTGQLDPSFGQKGKTVVSVPKDEYRSRVEMAIAPSGKSYVLDGPLLLAFGANGRPDQGFGKNGRVNVTTATGLLSEAADLTVDANGRILVTGSFEPNPGAVDHRIPAGEYTAMAPTQPISQAFVIRYLPNGERDASFGTNGEIDTTLDVPVPTNPEPGPNFHYESPTVYANSIAVVEGEKPVIGGHYIYGAQYCYGPAVPAYAYTARLETGAPGARTIPVGSYSNLPSTDVSALTPAPDGGLAVLINDGSGCPLRGSGRLFTTSFLNADGTVAAMDSARPVIPDLEDTLGVDPNGRMLAVEGPVELAGTGVPWKLIRLLPNGDFDTSFGSGGGMMLPGFDEESVHSISVDSRGRALIGGGNRRFRLVRIGTKAKIDHSFGNHGWAEAGFGKGTIAALSATTIDAKGRILAAGRVQDAALKTGEGIGIARFLPGK